MVSYIKIGSYPAWYILDGREEAVKLYNQLSYKSLKPTRVIQLKFLKFLIKKEFPQIFAENAPELIYHGENIKFFFIEEGIVVTNFKYTYRAERYVKISKLLNSVGIQTPKIITKSGVFVVERLHNFKYAPHSPDELVNVLNKFYSIRRKEFYKKSNTTVFVFSHGDFHYGNLPKENHRIFVLDFHNAGSASPFRDVLHYYLFSDLPDTDLPDIREVMSNLRVFKKINVSEALKNAVRDLLTPWNYKKLKKILRPVIGENVDNYLKLYAKKLLRGE